MTILQIIVASSEANLLVVLTSVLEDKQIMLIDNNLRSRYGATTDFYKPKYIIFGEGDTPKYYYQIISGSIKLNHIDENARELIISLLKTGDSICEVMLLLNPEGIAYLTEQLVISKVVGDNIRCRSFYLSSFYCHKSKR